MSRGKEESIDLGCHCCGGLAKAHQTCIETWFSIRGSNKCESQSVADSCKCGISRVSCTYFSVVGLHLKILGGKHMVEPDMVRVLGTSAFHGTTLTASGDLSYLGVEWRRELAFAGFKVPIQMDVSAEKMIFRV